MLKVYKSDCFTGNLRELSINALEKGAWFNLINPTNDEINAVAEAANVPMDILKSALDEEERSRTEIEDNCLLVITNVPIMRDKASYDTLPLGIILTKDYAITVCLENNEVLSEFNLYNSKLFSTFKKTRFLFQILYKSATLYLRYLRQISRLTDEIEKQLRRSMKNEELFQLLELQKGLTYFNVSLRSNGVVLEKLLRLRSNNNLQHIIKMFEEDEDLLEDVIIENQQAREMVEMYSRILTGMVATFASIISNNLNMVMKFLASMTIILAIPTMISSFFGMNVDVPFGLNNGFIYVSIIASVFTGISAFALWKKGLF
ncbi:magnesium transporter CorA family protein [Dendrosporobacter sp. 1207_IL3150]|uniref:magnesium transporter CorA family protein n=1 Tax=Dendrosporobacter sp. 1207_IL3150 TaxID=3084054 RepID=UPI002FDA7EDC